MDKKVPSKTFIVVRLRGGIHTIPRIKGTLEHLRLNQINHCVVVPNDKHFLGMLRVAKDYVTWGEVDQEVLATVIGKRGRLVGDKPITDDYIKSVTDFKGIQDFAAAIVHGKARYSDLKEVKPLFRLHPPTGGLKSTKRSFVVGGDLGYRGTAINALVTRMLEDMGAEGAKRKKEREAKRRKRTAAAAPATSAPRQAPKKAERKVVKKVAKKKAKKEE